MVFRTAGGEEWETTSFYKLISLILSITFAVVGLLFLFFSGEVLGVFNRVSESMGMLRGPEAAGGFYLGLAVSYMYLVSVIAFLMWRYPRERLLPLLLINGKAASSLLSVGLFVFDDPHLIFAANAVVDGAIAVAVLLLHKKYGGKVQ